MSKIFLIPMVLIAVVFSYGKVANAEQVYPIVNVNGSIISNVDLDQMVKFQKLLTNRFDNVPADKFKKMVLDEMVEDKIKQYDIDKYKVTVSNEELHNAVDMLEGRNGLAPGTFLKNAKSVGLPISAAYDQLKTQIAWNKLIRSFYFFSINVDPDDIDAQYQDTLVKYKLFANDYNISQIIYKGAAPRDFYNSIKRKNFTCSSFTKFAVENGVLGSGSLGYLALKDMSPAVANTIQVLSIKKVSPITEVGGENISYFICDTRKRAGVEPIPADYKDRIKYGLMAKKIELFSDKYLEKLKARSVVEYYN